MARAARRMLATTAGLLILIAEARGQGPTIPPATRPGSTGDGSSLGACPGSLSGGADPGTAGQVLGGRPGPSVPRVPSSITRPDRRGAVPSQGGISPPSALPLAEVPLFGPLTIP